MTTINHEVVDPVNIDLITKVFTVELKGDSIEIKYGGQLVVLVEFYDGKVCGYLFDATQDELIAKATFDGTNDDNHDDNHDATT